MSCMPRELNHLAIEEIGKTFNSRQNGVCSRRKIYGDQNFLETHCKTCEQK